MKTLRFAAAVNALAGITWGANYVVHGEQYWLLGSAGFFAAAGWFACTAWTER